MNEFYAFLSVRETSDNNNITTHIIVITVRHWDTIVKQKYQVNELQRAAVKSLLLRSWSCDKC